MSITCQRLLTELGNRAWSGFNKDDMVFGGDDAQTAQAELNSAIRYLVNLEDFPFKRYMRTLKTVPNQAKYSVPNGQIETIVSDDKQEVLTFLGDGATLDKEKVGKPEGYYITYSGNAPQLKLYPRPQEAKTYTITYSTYYPVIDGNTYDLKMEFTNASDTMNLPENLEYLFMDCLVLRTMVTNNKDNQDENYPPTIDEFNEAWRVFKQKAVPVRKDVFVRW